MRRPFSLLLLAPLGLALAAVPARAAVFEAVVEHLRRSDFYFGRTDGNAPFPPAGWVGLRSQGESEFTLDDDGDIARFRESSASLFAFAPVWVGRRDLVMLGGYAGWQRVEFSLPTPASREITTVMPLAAWLRQVGPRTQLGAFAAPIWTHGGSYAGHEFSVWSGYAGIIGTHWTSRRFAWIYGGIGDFSPEDEALLPYLGCLWQPQPQWTVGLIVPWPSVSYAPSRQLMFQFGAAPTGATLASAGDRLRLSYSSLNLQFSAHRRLRGWLWLSAAAGWSGFGSLAIDRAGRGSVDTSLDRGFVWSVQLSLRPTSGP